MKRIKRIHSHTGHAQFLFECAGDEDGATPIGYLPRQDDIPSPYAYSPTHIVYDHAGPVIIVETAHKVYDVFEVCPDLVFGTDEMAEHFYLETRKA